MDYDPVKDRFGQWAGSTPWAYRVFFGLLHVVFLRNWYMRRTLRGLLSEFRRMDRVRVLDAGSGFGQFSDYLLRSHPGVEVHAVDIKQDYLDRARQYFDRTPLASRITLAFDDLTRLQAEGPFDLIISVDVMEHIEEDVRVFRHFARVLRPGGHVVINTPSDRGGSDVHDEGEASFIGEHVRDGYGPDEIRSKLAQAGLQTESITWTYGRFGSWAWRLLIRVPMGLLGRSMLWLPVVALYYVPVLPIGLLLNALDLARPNPEGTGIQVVARRPDT